MNRIASFCIDHTKLTHGIYISRIDGDIVTYDIRMRKPNCPPFLPVPVMHTIEHLFATYARNSALGQQVIYFGPMGCRTGFYFLMRDTDEQAALQLILAILREISGHEGEIPGSSAQECGNYLEHDLAGAKKETAEFYELVKNWRVEDMNYPT